MDRIEIDRLIGQIYEGVVDDEAWYHMVACLRSAFKDATVAIVHNASNGQFDPVVAFTRFDPSLAELAVKEYGTADLNPGIAALLISKVGQPFTMDQIIDAETYRNNFAVQRILQPQGITQGLLVTVNRAPDSLTYVAMYRGDHENGFSDKERRLLTTFTPHFRKAFALRSNFRSFLQRDAVMASALNQGKEPAGVIILDQSLRVIEADKVAQHFLDNREGICIRGGCLASTSREPARDTESLHDYLKSNRSHASPFVIKFNSRKFLQLESVQISADKWFPASNGHRAILLRKIGLDGDINTDAFALAFALTPAEHRVVNALLAARGVTEAADHLALSRNTVKTHLSRIFGKTSCNTQSELMLLIGRFTS